MSDSIAEASLSAQVREAATRGGYTGPPPTTAQGDVLSAIASRIWFGGRAQDNEAATLLAHALHDQQPLSTMAGQIATVHALVAAFSHNGSPPGVRDAVKRAVVPLERAMDAVTTVLPDLANRDSRLHHVRKALMREMDPVARTVPQMHRGLTTRSLRASILRNDPFKSEKYSEKVTQYSGYPAFPTPQQSKMLIRQAVQDTVPKSMHTAVFAEIDRLHANNGLTRYASVQTSYKGRDNDFAYTYLPASVLRDTSLTPRFGPMLTDEQRQQCLDPARARLRQLTDLVLQQPPPTGDALAGAVSRTCGRQLTADELQRLSAALAHAVAPHSPAELVAMAYQAANQERRRMGLPDVDPPTLADAEDLPSYEPRQVPRQISDS